MDMETLVTITDTIDTYMYTYFLVFLLIGAGVYFTIRTKGVQFTHLKDMFAAITELPLWGVLESSIAFGCTRLPTMTRKLFLPPSAPRGERLKRIGSTTPFRYPRFLRQRKGKLMHGDTVERQNALMLMGCI